MSEDSYEDMKLKEVLLKLQALTKSIQEEKSKSQSYLERIKEFEGSLQEKDAEIEDLTKEKFDLKSKLSLEKSKQAPQKKNVSLFSSLMNTIMDKSDDSKVKKLEEKINQQNFEIKDLSQRLMEQKESFDQQKIQFQTMITLQNQQMNELKEKLEELKIKKEQQKDEKPEMDEKEEIELLTNNFNRERDEYSKMIEEYKNELKESREKKSELDKKVSEYEENFTYRNVENNAMKKQMSSYVEQINKLKKDIHEKQLTDRIFQVEKPSEGIGIGKSKKVMTIMFTWNKVKNIIEVKFRRLKDGGKSIKEEIVNILDIKTFSKPNNKSDTIDISFIVSIIIYNFYYFK